MHNNINSDYDKKNFKYYMEVYFIVDTIIVLEIKKVYL